MLPVSFFRPLSLSTDSHTSLYYISECLLPIQASGVTASVAATGSKSSSPATPRRAASQPPAQQASSSSSRDAHALQKAALPKADAPEVALQKAMPVPKMFGNVLQSGPKPLVRIGIDWHNTLEVRGQVSVATLDALNRLLDAGFHLSILSYIGKDSPERRATFYNQALALPMVGRFERVTDCISKVGKDGKVTLYKQWGISIMFDDNKEVCQEGMDNGLMVFPITTHWETHQWFYDLGFRPARTFAIAVGEFFRQWR